MMIRLPSSARRRVMMSSITARRFSIFRPSRLKSSFKTFDMMMRSKAPVSKSGRSAMSERTVFIAALRPFEARIDENSSSTALRFSATWSTAVNSSRGGCSLAREKIENTERGSSRSATEVENPQPFLLQRLARMQNQIAQGRLDLCHVRRQKIRQVRFPEPGVLQVCGGEVVPVPGEEKREPGNLFRKGLQFVFLQSSLSIHGGS